MYRSLWIFVIILNVFVCTGAYGEDKVVVVPLQSHRATGDAVEADVLKGKTFSNSDAVGLTGSRPVATLPKTGQDACYDPVAGDFLPTCAGSGQDGEYQKGVSVSPRFTDNGDGTVTDNLTDLVWLKDFNCFGRITWAAALSASNNLESGDCGLTDGSSPGDWRLPNRFELESLLDLKNGIDSPSSPPALPQPNPFDKVEKDYYWTSSYHSFFVGVEVAWAVHFSAGDVEPRSMIGLDTVPNCFVQAVRDKIEE